MKRDLEDQIGSEVGGKDTRHIGGQAAREQGALAVLEGMDNECRPLIIDPCRPHRVTLVPQTADRLTAGGKAASAQRKGKPRDLSQALIT